MHFSLFHSILVCFIVCDSSFFLLCSLLSLLVVHYARDCMRDYTSKLVKLLFVCTICCLCV